MEGYPVFRIRNELQDIMPCIHGGKLQETAELKGINEGDLLDFSVNLNPYIPADADVRGVITRVLDSVALYPDNRYEKFCRSAANFSGVRPENIIPGNGSTEVIRLFAESVINRGDIIAIPCPTFGEYEQQCRLFGANIRYIRYSDILKKEYWHMDGCKATFLCNPNNPDGRLIPAEDVLNIAAHCKENDIILVVDEAFIDLAEPAQSVAGYIEEYDNLFVIRSLTKCFSIPGLRVGFGIANAQVARALNNARLTWNLGSIASEVGIHYMDHLSSYLDISRAYINRERQWLMDNIKGIAGIRVLPSSANFFLIDVSGTGMTSREFTSMMLQEGVIVRDCSSFEMLGGSYVRLAVKTRDENEKLITALNKVAGFKN